MEKEKGKIEQIYYKYRVMFITTLLIGILAHSFILTNKLINHDDLECLFSKGLTYEIGRWGLEIIKYVIPNFSMPWFHGIITLLTIAISACLIVSILDIKSKPKQCLIGGAMIVFPTVTATLSYMFTASSYGIAILLSVLSVYFICKKKNIIGIICLVLSLGIYQAYVSITATLLVILLIKNCIEKEKSFKEIIITGVKYLAILLISLIIYMLVTNVILKISGRTLSEYQGANNMGHVTISSILKGIFYSYKSIAQILFVGKAYYGIAIGIVIKMMYLAILIISTYYGICHFIKISKESFKRAILFLLLCCILPITMNIVFILNANGQVHSLMLYANFFLAVLPIILSERLENKAKDNLDKITNVIIGIIIFNYITLANQSYLCLQLSFYNTQSFYTTLTARIESTEGFDKDTKISFVGEYSDEMLYNNREEFSNLQDLKGIVTNTQLISAYSKKNFIKYYTGAKFEYVSDEEQEMLENLEQVKEMNIYPYDNSVKKIGDTVVVKFSE